MCKLKIDLWLSPFVLSKGKNKELQKLEQINQLKQNKQTKKTESQAIAECGVAG